jgi:hypothetical protein
LFEFSGLKNTKRKAWQEFPKALYIVMRMPDSTHPRGIDALFIPNL